MPEVYGEQLDNVSEPLTMRQWFAATRLGRAVVGGLAAAGLATGVVALAASPAQAESSHTYTVEDTNGEGLWLHSDPGFDDGSDLITVVPEGTQVAADCYVHDSPVGSANNPAWLRITYQGAKGFVADAYTNSVWDQHNTLHDQGLELCQDVQPESQPAAMPQFNASAGVAWAINNARQPQEGGAQSPWFVSNALWQAGLPKTEAWTELSDYWNGTQYFDGILAAHAASDFVTYLEGDALAMRQDVGSINGSVIPGAQAGDVIAYDWQNDGYFDHLALVVGHDSHDPTRPMVAEWGQFDWAGTAASHNSVAMQSPYSQRAWDQSGTDSRPLAEVYPDATVQLLHINGN